MRDLKITPEAHFGLERYHLALLKYLDKDKEYQNSMCPSSLSRESNRRLCIIRSESGG
ncbi:MAG: hypothetical protein JWQ71_3910, partial [Pedosphaera sp.]|nr:hypothetical protein [Pedosphaera sp.]